MYAVPNVAGRVLYDFKPDRVIRRLADGTGSSSKAETTRSSMHWYCYMVPSDGRRQVETGWTGWRG
jgi:hypothetical protein